MKKVLIYFGLMSILLFTSACSLYIPMDLDFEGRSIRVLIIAEPDDASVLLNGKLIGEAFEFSTYSSALKLRSRDNELIIKKRGYIEEVIDLYEYSSSKITVRIKLRPDKYDQKQPPKTSVPLPQTKKTAKKPEHIAKEVTPIKKEETKKTQTQTAKTAYTDLTLSVTPQEASIYIDGEFFGISPKNGIIKNLKLKSAEHTISVLKPGFKAITYKIDLTGKKKFELSLHLIKK